MTAFEFTGKRALLLEQLLRKEGVATAAPAREAIPRRADRESARLSFAQQRLWFLEQLQPGLVAYNIPLGVRLSGRLDERALERALAEVLRRHEGLRTVFRAADGDPRQWVMPLRRFALPRVDLRGLAPGTAERELRRLSLEDALTPFDLARGPLIRLLLVKLGVDDHVLQTNTHHIASDGWSCGVLVRELSALYEAYRAGRPSPLAELPVQYADYAVWQRDRLSGAVAEAEVAYWRRRLEGAPEILELPVDRSRPPVQRFRGGSCPFLLDAGLTLELTALGRRCGATLFMTLLSAWAVMLQRTTGQGDLVIGSPVAGRKHLETEKLIGFFVNSLALRQDLSGDPSFAAVLDRVRAVVLDAFGHDELPFERLVEVLRPERYLSHTPMVQAMFALQNVPVETLALAGLTLTPVAQLNRTAKFDLALTLMEREGQLDGAFDYSAPLFDLSTILRMIEQLRVLLAAATADPLRPISELPLLGPVARQQLLEWNDRGSSGAAIDVMELFAAQARTRPAAPALLCEGAVLTYGELGRRADRLARRLSALGVRPGGAVGLCMDRSLDLVIGLIAILEAGGIYVPLDPGHPRSRLAFLIEDSGLELMITRERFVAGLAMRGIRTVLVDAAAAQEAAEETVGPPEVGPRDLAYLIYTSGTTGQPKAVAVERGSLAATLEATRHLFGCAPSDRMPCVAPFSFDIFLFELLSPLLTGGTSILMPLQPTLEIDRLVEALAEVTLFHAVPALMRQVVEAVRLSLRPVGTSLRAIFVGGDRVPPEVLEDLFETFPGARIWTLYGPTEATILCSAHAVSRPARPLLGRPLAGAAWQICDRAGRPVPVGVAGEIWIRGAGVARGYWKRDALTAEKYVRRDGERFFRSGDLARQLPDGSLEFLGRIDQQVKIRGFRVELGEVEAILARHPDVRQAVTDARPQAGAAEAAAKQLVAYVVRRVGAGGSTREAAARAERIDQWRALYEETYERRRAGDPLLNLEGWNSSYTDEPIPVEPMREWVEQTVARVLALGGRRVLEIGCGTGLLLYRIAPRVERYHGTDVSRVALDEIRRHLARLGGELANVSLAEGAADEWASQPAEDVDLVVLNSVVQYFPDAHYLTRVLEQAVLALARGSGGSVFVGDVRSLPLLESFHLSVALYQASPSLSVTELRRRVRRRVAHEEELVLAPGFFFALARRLPAIRRVEVLLKRGRWQNELTRFRYDVVLQVRGEPARSPDALLDAGWCGWRDRGLSLPALARNLEVEQPDLLALAGIPNARLTEEDAVAALFSGGGQEIETVGELRQALAERRTQLEPAVDPEDLCEVAERAGYAVELLWSDAVGTPESHFSAVLWRPKREGSRIPIRHPEQEMVRPLAEVANDPLRRTFARTLTPELRRFLQSELPEYLVPSAFVLLDSIPLTAHGKVDRAALPDPDGARPDLAQGFVPARTAVERTLAEIWARLLGLEAIGVLDNFFELGGHSLLATQVVSRVRQSFDVELPVRALFEAPTVAALAERIESGLAAGPAAIAVLPPIVALPRTAPMELPLSFAQQRLWFLDQLEPGSSAYNMGVALRLVGHLDRAAVALCLGDLVSRHESLRTTFGSTEGEPLQRIAAPPPAGAQPLPTVDIAGLPLAPALAEARRLATLEIHRPFHLGRGPLLRATLIRTTSLSGEVEHLAVLALHHIVADGWSIGVLVRDLAALYSARAERRPSSLAPLRIQYADYAAWQRSWLRGELLEGQLDFWRRRLAGAPEALDLPTDRPRPAVASGRGGTRPVSLPTVPAALAGLGRRQGVTPFIVLLAAWEALLHRYTERTDLLVGTAMANRRDRELEELIGFFVNTLPVRASLAGDPPFSALIERVRQEMLAVHAHQDLPFERLVEEVSPQRSRSHVPLVQVMFILQNTPFQAVQLTGLRLERFEVEGKTAKLDLTLSLVEGERGIGGFLEFSRDLFDSSTAARLLDGLATLLVAAGEDPERPLSELPLLPRAAAWQLLAEWNQTATAFPDQASIPDLFAAQASSTPDAAALTGLAGTLSYEELSRRALGLAHRLRRLGVGPEAVVGLCAERSPDLIVAMMAILEAGAAYLPLDPAYPVDRSILMLDDSRASLLLVQPGLAARFSSATVRTVLLGAGSPEEPGPEAPVHIAPESLAYVMYTSGSTGRPKGVAMPHRGIVRLVRETGYARFGSAEVWLHLTPISFDPAVLEIWGALLHGAQLVLFPDQMPTSSALGTVLIDHGVTSLWLTTALFHQIVEEGLIGFGSVRQLLAGGDVLSPEHVRRARALLPDCRLVNGYGPTENATLTSCHTIASSGDSGSSVPIGRPIANTIVHLLDSRMQPVSIGVGAELYTGGAGLARGYLGQPALTAQRFVPDPWSREAGARLYRTGDLVRHRPDGVLEFLGRIDQQVKVRGFRVEPGEVEAVLNEHPGVRQAAVVVLADGLDGVGVSAGKRLVAYVSAADGGLDTAELRRFLADRLPSFMVPSALWFRDRLPLTSNGKLDRRALSALGWSSPVPGTAAVLPATPVEEGVLEIWREVLRPDPRHGQVGVDDDFFALGGHSLLAMRVAARISAAFGVDLSLRTLFEEPTVRALAASVAGLLRDGRGTVAPPLRAEPRGEEVELSFAQQRLWFLDQLEPESGAYDIPLATRLDGDLDVSALRWSLHQVVRRHESLRTLFRSVAGRPVQVVLSAAAASSVALLPYVDLSSLPAARREAEALALAAGGAWRPFDLARGLLLRAYLVRLAGAAHLVLARMHHIVSDGWSLGVLMRELSVLYADRRAGRPSRLPPLAVQYADYALWQRRWLTDEVLDALLTHWRRRLAGLPTFLNLPTDRPRPAARTNAGARHVFPLHDGLVTAARDLARSGRSTLFMVFLAGFQALLARLTGQLDLAVGTAIAGRGQREVEGLIGLFANTLVLRGELSGGPSFHALLACARETVLDAYAHADLPFERLVDELVPERSLAHTPVFQVMLELQARDPAIRSAADFPGLAAAPFYTGAYAAKFDLVLSLFEAADGGEASLGYSTDLFDAATMVRLAERFQALLGAAVERLHGPALDLPCMTAAERHQLLWEWPRGEDGEGIAAGLVNDAVEARALRAPDTVALVCAGETITYGELSAGARRLAGRLRGLGVGPEVAVGVAADRSPDLVVALLGVLASGGVYLPLDMASPDERVASLLAEGGVRTVVASPEFAARDALQGYPIAPLRDTAFPGEGDDGCRPGMDGSLAYTIFTSGSTGRPRGVAVEHRQARAHCETVRRVYGLDERDRVLQFASSSFDVSLEQILPALAAGATLVLRDSEVWSIPEFLGRLAEEGVTVANLPTAYWQRWVRDYAVEAEFPAPRGLRLVIAGGEEMRPETARLWPVLGLSHARLLNAYGPTEAVITASFAEVTAAEGGATVPIGRPLPGRSVYVLDPVGRPQPLGVPGELYLGGLLARGYLGLPERTAERFVPDPLGGEPGSRLYRSGDLARTRADGTLELLGRLDRQVKIRGFRIEPGEIEAALVQQPGIREAVVVLRPGLSSERQLIAYVVPREGDLDLLRLRAALRARLPEHLVPALFVQLAELPLTTNGKVDRAALPAPEAPRSEGAGPPRTRVEELLARIWAEVLGQESVGVGDNFFELGGDSIQSIQVVARAAQAGWRIKPRQMFECQTVAELAAVAVPTTAASERSEPGAESVPLTPIQLWFLDDDPVAPQHFNQAVLLAVGGGLLPSVVESALGVLLRHHETLRLRFLRGAQGWWQQLAPPAASGQPRIWARLDLSALAPPRAVDALRRSAMAIQGGFDLAAGNLLRGLWIDLPAGESRLLLVVHHLVVDGVSWRILLEDLDRACRQLGRGAPPELPARTTSFLVWAKRLAEHARSMSVEPELSWWEAEVGGARATAAPPEDEIGTVEGERTVTSELGPEETGALLTIVPAAYRTQINDILLTALALTLADASGSLLVDLEGHGREELLEDIDLSRTVGWFTTQFPLRLQLGSAHDLGEALRSVKEHLRSIPRHGIGYGLLRYLRRGEAAERLGALAPPRVVFNYLGQLDLAIPVSSLFSPAAEPVGLSRSPRARRSHHLAVGAMVGGGRLRMSWTYAGGRHPQREIEALAARFETYLRDLIAHCRSVVRQGRTGYTPSDFPLAGIDQVALDRLLEMRTGIEDLYPLSPLQEGILLESLRAPAVGVYVGQTSCTFHGTLAPVLLETACRSTLERNPSLRAAFHWQGLERPLQAVHRQVSTPFLVEDWRGLSSSEAASRFDARCAAEIERGFDLACAPLMRWTLVRVAEREHRLIWTHHHLLLDGWSFSLVAADLLATWGALRDGREHRQVERRPYRDYVSWLGRQDRAAAEAYWRSALAGWTEPPALALSARAVRTQQGSGPREARLAPAETAALAAQARRHHLTLSTVTQAAWGLLLARYLGLPEAVFGATVSERPGELPGVESMVGLFINTLPVRCAADAVSLVQWLRDLQSRQVEMRQHGHVSLLEIQTWSEIPRGRSIFESILVFESYPLDAAIRREGAALGAADVRAVERAHYPLTVVVAPSASLSLRIDFDASRFDVTAIDRMLGHLACLLRGVVALEWDGRRPTDLILLSAAERHQLAVEWSGLGAERRWQGPVQAWVEAQVDRTPDAVAVVCGGEALSFGELERRANRAARSLRRLGIGLEARVGLCIERSLELAIGLLAIFKSGGAFLPLDPALPRERLGFLLADSAAQAVVGSRQLAEDLALPVLCLDSLDQETGGPARDEQRPPILNGPGSLAYVIYTSGSTGQPKAVLVEHGNLSELLRAAVEEFSWTAGDRMAVLAAFSFDIFLFELLCPLVAGGCAIIEPLLPASSLGDLTAELGRVTRLHAVPSLMGEIVDAVRRKGKAGGDHRNLRTIFTGGDAVPAELLAGLRETFPASEIRVLYGPTEGTVLASSYAIPPRQDVVLSAIGRPLPHAALFLCDAEGREVPIGVVGEICIGGGGVTRGYLHQAGLTADSYRVIGGHRAFRTGDLARHLPDGNLEFLGRLDDQVKIRGFRIEPGEVEAVLRANRAVHAATVVAEEDPVGGRRLVAYLVADAARHGDLLEDAEVTAALRRELQEFVAARLPAYMTPSAFVFLDALPLTRHGKVDRRGLSTRRSTAPHASELASPRTDAEKGLARIWCEVLRLDRVHRGDDFFALGGHSLAAARVASRIREVFHLEVSLRDLFACPTLDAMAGRIDEASIAASDGARLDELLAALDAMEHPAHELLGNPAEE